MKKIHGVLIWIECDDAQSKDDAEERLKRWLEHFGHTAPSFGFTFETIGEEEEDAKRKARRP